MDDAAAPATPVAPGGGENISEPKYGSFKESVDSEIFSEAIDEADECIDIDDDE